jgi:hypothetical protein
MNNIDELTIMASIIGEHCHLNHGPDPEQYTAADCLIQPMGYTQEENKPEDTTHITIPICKECAEGLLDPTWLLMYCLDCHNNQWVNRERATLEYSLYNIIWFKGCPKCSKKPTAIYFN